MDTTKVIIGLLIAAVVVVVILMYVPLQAPSPADSGVTTGTGGSGAGGNLTADEQKVLMPPAENASAEELAAYSQLVWGLAQETTTISVGANCKVNPVVITATEGSMLTVNNTDSVAHTLAFDADHSLTVGPNETKKIDLSFWNAGRLYPYPCDANADPVGIVIVTE